MSSESPKWIALVLSVFAITISGLSWWESHRNRLVAEEVNRPILSDSKGFEITVNRNIGSTGQMEWRVLLKNTGKQTASIDRGRFQHQIVNVSPNDCSIVNKTDGVLHGASFPQHPIPAGEEAAVVGHIELSQNCDSVKLLVFIVDLEIIYTDPGGREYIQHFDGVVPLTKEGKSPRNARP